MKSKFHDIGASGIRIGLEADATDLRDRTSGAVVHGNTVSRIGETLQGAVGIWQGLANGSRITANRVSDVPYTGISLGWEWSAKDKNSRDNHIVGNHISRAMRELTDGGGIYVLGRQENSRIADNLIYNIIRHRQAPGKPVMGIYHDQGSSGWALENNLVGSAADYPFYFNRPANIRLKGKDTALDEVPPITATGYRQPWHAQQHE